MPLADDDQEWEVEKIIDAKKKKGVQHYLVQWEGWPEEYTSWESAEDTANAEDAIAAYYAREGSGKTAETVSKKRKTRN